MNNNDSIAYFLSFCVEIYKDAHSLSGEEASSLLLESGALDYLKENYDVIHTQSHHWILSDLEEFLSNTKKTSHDTLPRKFRNSKGGDKMIGKITNENLYLILPGKVSRMVIMYAEDFGLSITEALKRIYKSATYSELEKEETKLWHLGPVALYEMFLENAIT